MKIKALFLFLALLASASIKAQTPIVYKGTIELPGQSVQQIFNKVATWYTGSARNVGIKGLLTQSTRSIQSRSVYYVNDNEAFLQVTCDELFIHRLFKFNLTYTITFSVTKGQCSYEISNFYYKHFALSMNPCSHYNALESPPSKDCKIFWGLLYFKSIQPKALKVATTLVNDYLEPSITEWIK